MSPKSRRSSKKNTPPSDEPRPKPRLHAHQRIRSDPVQADPPLTIDQHLSNYQESLRAIPSRSSISTLASKASQLTSPTLSSASCTIQQPVPAEEERLFAPANISTFYHHFPLSYSSSDSHLPYTLLHPAQPQPEKAKREWSIDNDQNVNDQDEMEQDDSNDDQNGNDLLRLAQIVSTFG